MTDKEFKIVELICKVHKFVIHPANEFAGRVVTNKQDKNRSSLYWQENEGIEEFIEQVAEYFRECGYESASGSGW